MYQAVIFDFDGTICDTGEGIFKSARYALEAFGYKVGENEDLSFFIGPPLLVAFQEHYGASAAEAEELVHKYRERYTNTGLYECELYDGMVKLLSALKKHGIKLGVASSKPKKYIDLLLHKFNIMSYFDAVCGTEFRADCESKPSIISRCLTELGVAANETIVAGDRRFDIEGAKANMADGIGVLWGYGTREELLESGAVMVVEKPADLEAVVLGLYEQTDRRESLFDGHVLKMHLDEVTLCNGKTAQRECVDHPGGVAVIGINEDNEVLLVRQFRYPYKEVIYEIPAGKVEPGEDPFETGKREFKEECGAVAQEYFSLGEIYPSPGYTNEIIRLFGARGITFENQELDEDEFLEVHKMKLPVLIDRIMSGDIKDAKTVAAALKLQEYLKRK